MKKPLSAAALVLLVAGSFAAGSLWSPRRAARAPAGGAERKPVYYVDPMHPAYKSDKPGIAPDCGMELVPVYADGKPEAAGSAARRSPGGVTVSPEKQQVIGMKVAAVERAPVSRTLRVPGRVAPDESRVYRVNSATDGWVKKILPFTTGSLVRSDELLATFFAPEFFSAAKAYLYGLRSLDRFATSGRETQEQLEVTGANIDSYRNALRNLGMTEHQMDEIARTRRTPDTVEVRAPTAGFLLARNISPGQRFEKGTELYRIADLAFVWVLADLFENEASFVAPGLVARVSTAGGARTFTGRVSRDLPLFDSASRTLKVRLEVANPGYALRPDMFVDVELPVSLPSALTVPADAILDAGLRKTVFVDEGEGHFEPRTVETGWRLGDRVEIVKGLMEGERIVASGTFLVDSESRMKSSAAGIQTPEADPVCGMQVDRAKSAASGRTRSYGGRSYSFCSDGCARLFDASPGRYVPQAPNSPAAGTGAPSPLVAGLLRPRREVEARAAASLVPAAAPDLPFPDGAHAGREPGSIPPTENAEAELEPGTSADPACGDIVSVAWAASAGLKVEYGGRTYSFATKECKELFESHPEQYVARTAAHAHAGPGSAGASAASVDAVDPVCGMEVDAAEARAAGRTSEHAGRTYAFCSALCKERFDKDPTRYAGKP
jgi:Cu(I)/Ag(I) efflux system membrane fusion protein